MLNLIRNDIDAMIECPTRLLTIATDAGPRDGDSQRRQIRSRVSPRARLAPVPAMRHIQAHGKGHRSFNLSDHDRSAWRPDLLLVRPRGRYGLPVHGSQKGFGS